LNISKNVTSAGFIQLINIWFNPFNEADCLLELNFLFMISKLKKRYIIIMVRIISGIHRGSRIKVPRSSNKIRPTADRVKEALFSILGDKISNARFLDLFCGCGNVGLEALSRGAQMCWFVEKNNQCLRCLDQNIHSLGVEDKARIFRGDVKIFSSRYENRIPLFDVVFADPPYKDTALWFSTEESINLLHVLYDCGIVSPFAVFVIEHSKDYMFPDHIMSRFELKQKRYGGTAVTIFSCGEKEDYHGQKKQAGDLSG
jgi:16S rRNA (guanine(966)-N(2))-methyltransferase RsmD